MGFGFRFEFWCWFKECGWVWFFVFKFLENTVILGFGLLVGVRFWFIDPVWFSFEIRLFGVVWFGLDIPPL